VVWAFWLRLQQQWQVTAALRITFRLVSTVADTCAIDVAPGIARARPTASGRLSLSDGWCLASDRIIILRFAIANMCDYDGRCKARDGCGNYLL